MRYYCNKISSFASYLTFGGARKVTIGKDDKVGDRRVIMMSVWSADNHGGDYY